MRRRSTAVAVLVLSLALTLSGCSSPRDALGPNSSRCFRALAIAKEALGGGGVYAGVRLLSAADFVAVVRRVEGASAVSPALERNRDAVCAVNYRGHFVATTATTVAPPEGRGGYAVVAVDAHTGRILGTYLVDRPPLRFSKVLA